MVLADAAEPRRSLTCLYFQPLLADKKRVKLSALVDEVASSSWQRERLEAAVVQCLGQARDAGVIRFDGKKVKPVKKRK
jgi:hypothetical protein